MFSEISPRYLMKLVADVNLAIVKEYGVSGDDTNIKFYLEKWHEADDFNWQNFYFKNNEYGRLDLLATLHTINGETLLKIAIDLGIATPDFIPSVPTFRNEIKSDYKNASITFEKALKQINADPDIAISLANSALESIIKEIFKDDRIKTKPKASKTLYDLASDLLKEL